jgi:hypothetical protein
MGEEERDQVSMFAVVARTMSIVVIVMLIFIVQFFKSSPSSPSMATGQAVTVFLLAFLAAVAWEAANIIGAGKKEGRQR